MSNIIIYVICYDDTSEQKAQVDFSSFPWARIYRIPQDSQNHLFEGVMYQSELIKVYDEWKNKEFVGTISYSLPRKMKLIHLEDILQAADSSKHDAVFFKTFPNDFFDLHSNPELKCVYNDVYRKIMPLRISCIVKRYALYNYWMAKPPYMLQYIWFFNNRWLPALESHPLVWNNAGYKDERLSKDQLLSLTKRVSHYPMHPFVNERIPYRFFKELNLRLLF